MARAGRRPGQTETREQILTAARTQFAELGYDGATIRGIAARAEVNPALVHHFFGTKEQVFVAALQLPIDPAFLVPALLDGPKSQFGERFVRLFLTVWGNADTRAPFLAMMRSVTTNEQAARMLRQFLERHVLARIAAELDVPQVRLAAAAAHMVGLAMFRYVIGIEPLAKAGDDEIVAMVGPVIQTYIDG
ncbi:AcrR family transcriptional regulator [Kibdelosporangium banguiense]|uniref:AcrR family transcriptional regulator n=1 Tax=Kibdelosporangium banguiense TaxID=1365924 RepID=A0ABS4TJA2_9PSEU|nr:TetR family transcriptional regulator [Kibdelosporangium banguiense]MBP2324084.1 AcrR family transcriptional regulator [Kibdelosporangium banguiense]